MKDKLISYNSLVTIFQPDFRLSFGTISPLPNISSPTTTIFYEWAGSATLTSTQSVAMGTIARWRFDSNDEQPLNRDLWKIISTATPSLVRVIEEIRKDQIPYHHAGSLPASIKQEAPNWVEEQVNRRLGTISQT